MTHHALGLCMCCVSTARLAGIEAASKDLPDISVFAAAAKASGLMDHVFACECGSSPTFGSVPQCAGHTESQCTVSLSSSQSDTFFFQLKWSSSTQQCSSLPGPTAVKSWCMNGPTAADACLQSDAQQQLTLQGSDEGLDSDLTHLSLRVRLQQQP